MAFAAAPFADGSQDGVVFYDDMPEEGREVRGVSGVHAQPVSLAARGVSCGIGRGRDPHDQAQYVFAGDVGGFEDADDDGVDLL